MLVINKNRVLLVRVRYFNDKWNIPGGMVDKGESFETAAKREVKEESGLEISEVEFIGSLYSEREYKKDTVQYFIGETDNEDLVIDNQEITGAGWFALDDLPHDRVSRVDEGVKLYNDWKKDGKATNKTLTSEIHF